MALTPQAQSFLEEMASKRSPKVITLSPPEARLIKDLPLEPGPEVAKVEDHVVAYSGGEVPVRVYTPHGKGPFPVLVWFHGGGWVLGRLKLADGTCRQIVNDAGCSVVSVEYRLAPEHKFPAAPNDAYAATEWVANNAARLEIDPNRLAVGGDSAGGNLATVVSMMARDSNGPQIIFQLLVYPVTDRNFDTKSYLEKAPGTRLTRELMQWFWGHYLRSDDDACNPYAAPLQAKDLSKLPPALVITAEYDPLCDEGEAYAERLRQAGVPTVCTRYEGVPHLFYLVPGRIPEGKAAVAESCKALRRAFNR